MYCSFRLNRLTLMLVACSVLCSGSRVSAEMGISGSAGYGVERVKPLRLGWQKTFKRHWCTQKSWILGGYWEGSLYRIGQGKTSRMRHCKTLHALAGAGVFRFERVEKIKLGWPYLELGVGLSWLSHKELGNRKLGMHFQFEDRMGIGIRFGNNREFDVGYKVVHFSNAYLGAYNHGINVHFLTVGFWFQ